MVSPKIKLKRGPWRHSYDQGLSLVKEIMKCYTYEDIVAELQLRFIKCVDIYNRQSDGPGFVGFIYGYYKYTIKNWFNQLSADILNSMATYPYEENVHNEEHLTAPSVFVNICFSDMNDLSNLERYVLYLSFNRMLLDREISDLFDVSRPYVSTIKKRGLKKLEESGITISDFSIN